MTNSKQPINKDIVFKNKLKKIQPIKDNEFVISQDYLYKDKLGETHNPYSYIKCYNEKDFINIIYKYPNNNLFETLTRDINKFYIDIDIDDKIKNDLDRDFITNKQLDRIINIFIKQFNSYFKQQITNEDILILIRDENRVAVYNRTIRVGLDDNKQLEKTDERHKTKQYKIINKEYTEKNPIRSIHLILPKYKTYKKVIKQFVEHLYNILTIFIDLRVYGGNRNFNLINNTKTKNNNKRIFKPYNNISKRFCENIKNAIISIISNTTELIEKPNRWKNLLKPLVSENDDGLELKRQIKQPNINNKNTIVCNKFNIIDLLLKDEEIRPLFNKQYGLVWILITKYMILHDFSNIDKWLEFSSLNTDLPNKWTETKNKKFKNNIINDDLHDYVRYEINVIKYIIVNINKIVSSFQYYYKYTFDYNTPKTKKWINSITKISIEEIDRRFRLALVDNSLTIKLSEEWSLYTKNLTLTNNKTQINYWIEYYKTIKNDKTNLDQFIKMDILKIQDEVKPFLLNDKLKIMCVNAKWGTGKTHFVIKEAVKTLINEAIKQIIIKELPKEKINGEIDKYFEIIEKEEVVKYIDELDKDKIKILFITENNTLNSQIYNDFKNDFENLKINNHQLLVKPQFENDSNLDICSLESIKKCKYKDYNIVLIDESESILNHFESETMETNCGETAYNKLIIIKKLLTETKKIILLDADLSIDRVRPLLEECIEPNKKIEDKSVFYYSNQNKWKDYKFNLYVDNEKDFWYDLHNDIKNNKKLCIPIQSKTNAECLNEYFRETFNNKNILMVVSELISLNGIRQPRRTIEKLEDFIIDNNVDIFIYSPRVKTGTSINMGDVNKNEIPIFNKCYVITNSFSCCARELLQMCFRVRHLKNKQINILLPKLNNIIEPPTNLEIQRYLLNNRLLYGFKDVYKLLSIEEKQLTESSLYLKIKIYNKLEIWNSYNNFSHEIIKKLTINHNINVNFIIDDTKKQINLKEMGRFKDEIREEKIKLFTQLDLIDKEQFNHNRRLIEFKLTDEIRPIRENQKYLMFRTLYLYDNYFYREEQTNLIQETPIKYKIVKPNPTLTIIKKKQKRLKLIKNELIEIIEDVNDYTTNYEFMEEAKLIEKYEYPYFKKPIERINLFGDICSYRNGNIEKKYYNNSNIIHDNFTAIEVLLRNFNAHKNLRNSINMEVPLIDGEDKQKDLSNKQLKENKHKLSYIILSKLLKEVYVNNETLEINLKPIKISTKEFRRRIKFNEPFIKKRFNLLVEETLKSDFKDKFNWNNFNSENVNDRKILMSVLHSCLSFYGLNLYTPNHSSRKPSDKVFYKIYMNTFINRQKEIIAIEKPKRFKLTNDNKVIVYNNDEEIKYDFDELFSVNIKTKKITLKSKSKHLLNSTINKELYYNINNKYITNRPVIINKQIELLKNRKVEIDSINYNSYDETNIYNKNDILLLPAKQYETPIDFYLRYKLPLPKIINDDYKSRYYMNKINKCLID